MPLERSAVTRARGRSAAQHVAALAKTAFLNLLLSSRLLDGITTLALAPAANANPFAARRST